LKDRVTAVRQQLATKKRAIRPKVDALSDVFGLRSDPAFEDLLRELDDPSDLAWLDKLADLLDLVLNRSQAIANQRESVVASLRSIVARFSANADTSLLDLNVSNLKWINGLARVLHDVSDAVNTIEEKYDVEGGGFMRQLIPFMPSQYLGRLAGNAFRVHETDSATKKHCKDHILCKLIGTNYLMLKSLIKAPESKDVNQAYHWSEDLAKEIADGVGSLLWATNMKYPSIYSKNPSVADHYKRMRPILKERPRVDTRRIHLFYKVMADADHRKKGETEWLMGTLVGEYLMGINSRVLWLRHCEDIYDNGMQPGKKVGCLHLLDYALGYLPGTVPAVPGSGGSKFHILCADFTAQPKEETLPSDDWNELLNQSYDAQDSFEAQDRYKRGRVYNLSEPALFPLFQQHFLAMWNVAAYADRLMTLYQDDSDVKKLAQTVRTDASNYCLGDFIARVGNVEDDYFADPHFRDALEIVYPLKAADDPHQVAVNVRGALKAMMGKADDSGRKAVARRLLDEVRVRRYPGPDVELWSNDDDSL
jgi:hypothetical protein